MFKNVVIVCLFGAVLSGCSTFERNPRDFKRVATENKLVRTLNPASKAQTVFTNLASYANRCFRVSGSVTRQDQLNSVTIINEQRAQIHSYSLAPFHGEILIRWFTKPDELENDGNIFFLADVRDGESGNAKVGFYGNQIFDNEKYFESFSAIVAGRVPKYCPGK
jgi:hypothetical protein